MTVAMLLITFREGETSYCAECSSSDVSMVVHYMIDYIVWDKDIDGETKKALNKRYKKEAVERFLCRPCWERNWFWNPDRWSEGVAQFTSPYLHDWRKKTWHLKHEVESKILKKN